MTEPIVYKSMKTQMMAEYRMTDLERGGEEKRREKKRKEEKRIGEKKWWKGGEKLVYKTTTSKIIVLINIISKVKSPSPLDSCVIFRTSVVEVNKRQNIRNCGAHRSKVS
jgi:hypothetical protein